MISDPALTLANSGLTIIVADMDENFVPGRVGEGQSFRLFPVDLLSLRYWGYNFLPTRSKFHKIHSTSE